MNEKETKNTTIGEETANMTAEGVSDASVTAVDETVTSPVGKEDEGTGHGSNRKRNIIIAASVAAVLLLAAGAGGYAYACNNVNAGMQAAAAQAINVDKQLSGKLKEAKTLLDGTTKEQVADEATLTKLADAIKTAGSQQGVDESTANRWLVWQTMGAQSAYDSDTEDAQAVIESLDKTMDAVNDSINDKKFTDAKDALSKAIDAAQATLNGSDGKVQDNATRDALSKALDAAKKALDGTDVEAMATAKSGLENKANAVNDSVKAKEQADAEAQAQAEAAANAAASSGSGYGGGGYTGYSGGYNGGSTGGYYGGPSGGYSGGGYSGNYTGGGSVPVPDFVDSMGNHAQRLTDNGDGTFGWSMQIF